MVEPFEMKGLLLGEKAAENILPEPLRSEMKKAVSALFMKNENGMAEEAEVECFQILFPEHLPKPDPAIFLTCYDAWEKRQDLLLTYRSGKNHVSEKHFEPHIFAWNGGSWYLKGKLYREDGKNYDTPLIRVLALHRIEKAEMLDGKFYPAPELLKNVQEEGLFDFQKIPDVVVEFFTPFDLPMWEKYKHIPGAVKERKENSVILHLHNLTEYEAAQLVLSTCGNAKVYEPADLRLYLRRIANKILDYLDH